MKRLILLGIVLTMTGCHSMGSLGGVSLPWASGNKVIESRYQSPARMVAIWSDATYNSAGKKPVRGFGGRLYFYNEKQVAVPIEGQLVIYAYDDTDLRGPAAGPSRKYVFTPEQLTEHFSETELGASYSIWLPWDELGGEQKSISLLPILTASSGQVITGTSSLTLLPGTRPQAEEREYFSRVEPESAGARQSLSKLQATDPRYQSARGAGEIARVGYEQELGSSGGPKPVAHMETTTIVPTKRLAEQMLSHRSQLATAPPRKTYDLPVSGTQALYSSAGGVATEQSAAAELGRFSRRPGESYPSRIYTGQVINPRAALPAWESVPDSLPQ